jgi:hypothetical protein
MKQQMTHPTEVVTAQELPGTDLEKIVAGKDGNYWWGTVTSGAAAVEAAQRGQSRELVHGHIK